MKGFFDPVIGGALLLIYGAIALLAVNGQRQEDYQATSSATEQVASVDADTNHAQDRQAERR
jgi:hypothetical protein